jgi:sigma-B regulation protein RsbQ
MFIEVNQHLLNVVSFGTGPTTILGLGGWVGNWEVWQQPFERLSTRWRCVSFDHRGSGESVVPAEHITPEGLVDDVFGVMRALGIGRCILAGESLGAFVALQAALRDPAKFSGLVLVDGAPAVTADVAQPLIDGTKRDFEATLSKFVDGCIPEPDSDHLRRWGRDILRRADARAAARIFDCYLERPPPPADLERISMPTLVIHGTKDAIVPLRVGQWMAKKIPNARLVTMEGVGHVPTVTRPHEVVDAILAWAADAV